MVASAPILATRAGLPVYIPNSAESGTPVRARLIERLVGGLRTFFHELNSIT